MFWEGVCLKQGFIFYYPQQRAQLQRFMVFLFVCLCGGVFFFVLLYWNRL